MESQKQHPPIVVVYYFSAAKKWVVQNRNGSRVLRLHPKNSAQFGNGPHELPRATREGEKTNRWFLWGFTSSSKHNRIIQLKQEKQYSLPHTHGLTLRTKRTNSLFRYISSVDTGPPSSNVVKFLFVPLELANFYLVFLFTRVSWSAVIWFNHGRVFVFLRGTAKSQRRLHLLQGDVDMMLFVDVGCSGDIVDLTHFQIHKCVGKGGFGKVNCACFSEEAKRHCFYSRMQ